MFKPSPNVPGVIAGRVLFSIDLRHTDNGILRLLGDRVDSLCKANSRSCQVNVTEISTAESIHFPKEIVTIIRRAADTWISFRVPDMTRVNFIVSAPPE
jgi:N-carbamoyl-L-amino-acid hydrolase